jgi:4-azaleucine resistance transporter AzlC
MKCKAWKAAVPFTLPVFMGYLFLGIAFGVLLTSRGFPAWLAILMSVVIYAGSGQFVAIGLLSGPFDPLSAALVTLMINARHLFYGLSLLDLFHSMGPRKPYMIFSLTDETYSLLCAVTPPEGVDRNWFYFFISLMDQSYWILGSLIGATAGSLLAFDSTGIDFAMTALFIVIFVEQWEHAKSHAPAVLGVAVSLLCLFLAGRSRFILASMAGIFLCLTLLRGKLEGKAADTV